MGIDRRRLWREATLRALFSKEFLDKIPVSTLANRIAYSILNRENPHRIIETLVKMIESNNKELERYRRNEVRPIVITVTKENFDELLKTIEK